MEERYGDYKRIRSELFEVGVGQAREQDFFHRVCMQSSALYFFEIWSFKSINFAKAFKHNVKTLQTSTTV